MRLLLKLSERISMRILTGSLLISAALTFVLVNVISGTLLNGLHLDITQGRFYTLSKASKQIIQQLEEPVTLRLYFSKTAIQSNHYLKNYAARVMAMLQQYKRIAKNKIQLEIIDPLPFSNEAEDAINYGLQAITIGDQEVFFGLVGTNSLDAQQVIPFFMPNREGNLEYDLSQILENLADPKARIIGIMSALPLQNVDGTPWAIRAALDQQFVIKDIDIRDPKIPGYLSTLMVVDPSNFNEEALRAIDEFVQNDGHVLVFIDPYSELGAKPVGAGNAKQLLAAWGIELVADKVVADHKLGRMVRLQQEGHEITTNYPLWMDFIGANFNQSDVVTGVLDRLTMASPGALRAADNSNTYFMPLITTTDEAMLVPTESVPDTQTDVGKFVTSYRPEGQYTVAARLSGSIRSPYTQRVTSQSSIIVVADTDMLHDHFWVNAQNFMGSNYDVPTSGNGNFVLSAVDNLLGRNQLIEIRNRGVFSRPFVKVQELLEESRTIAIQNEVDPRSFQQSLLMKVKKLRLIIEFFSFGLMPIGVIGAGLYVYTRMRRRMAA